MSFSEKIETEPTFPIKKSEVILSSSSFASDESVLATTPSKGEFEVVPEEDFLTPYENGTKPWFLTSTAIYKIVKEYFNFVATSIPQSETLFHNLLQNIEKFTAFINLKTEGKVAALDAEQCQDLIRKLDDLLTDQFERVDGKFDNLRIKLVSSVRLLIIALMKHKEWVKSLSLASSKEATLLLQGRFEIFQSSLLKLVEKLHENVSKAAKPVQSFQSKVEETKLTIQSQVTHAWNEYIYQGLLTVQPYVQSAVGSSLPYAQPYYEKYSPYFNGMLQRASGMENSLMKNPLVGSYVEKIHETSVLIFQEVKVYALPAH